MNDDVLFLMLAMINGLALIVKEIGFLKGKVAWLAPNWIRWTLLISVLLYLLIPTESLILDPSHSSISILPFVLLLGVIFAAFGVYRFVSPDLFALAQCSITLCVVILTALGNVILDRNNPFVWLFFGFIVVITVSVMAFILRLIGSGMTKEAAKKSL